MTDLMVRYVKSMQVEDGLAPATIESQCAYVAAFGDWLADRGAVEAPNRRLLREVMPKIEPRLLTLPDPGSDIKTISCIRDASRNTNTCMSSWPLWLLVRGVGCRPSEAVSLTWRSVNIEQGTIRFLSTKEGRRKSLPFRTAPILLQWVHDGLVALAKHRPSADSPVCLTLRKEEWHDERSAGHRIRHVQQQLSLPHITLKVAQKLYIGQLIRLGYPPHAIARWTGHALTIQEQHYCEEHCYLPIGKPIDLGAFDALSDFGKRTLAHVSVSFQNVTQNVPKSADHSAHQ